MLALLGLLGAALTAAAFVDVSSEAEDAVADGVSGDAGAGSTEGGEGAALSFDILLDDPEEEPGEVMTGSDADDVLRGGRGADDMAGNGGDDELWGALGDDQLSGGTGDDHLNGGDGADDLTGGDGQDTLEGSWGDDTLTGGAGRDVLNGGGGNDLLYGQDADFDYLNGGNGADTLVAGGADNLNGGDGADIFDLTQAASAHIDDFDPAIDRIEIEFQGVPPTLTTQTGDNGLTLLADGAPVATLAGLEALDLSQVALIPV